MLSIFSDDFQCRMKYEACSNEFVQFTDNAKEECKQPVHPQNSKIQIREAMISTFLANVSPKLKNRMDINIHSYCFAWYFVQKPD
jgi:hypothetical protein